MSSLSRKGKESAHDRGHTTGAGDRPPHSIHVWAAGPKRSQRASGLEALVKLRDWDGGSGSREADGVCVCARECTQSCPALCDLKGCSLRQTPYPRVWVSDSHHEAKGQAGAGSRHSYWRGRDTAGPKEARSPPPAVSNRRPQHPRPVRGQEGGSSLCVTALGHFSRGEFGSSCSRAQNASLYLWWPDRVTHSTKPCSIITSSGSPPRLLPVPGENEEEQNKLFLPLPPASRGHRPFPCTPLTTGWLRVSLSVWPLPQSQRGS